MQHLLRVSQERNLSPALQEINRVFGARLEGEAMLRYVNRAGCTVAQLTVQPLVVGGGRDLAREVGHFLWRNTDRALTGVEVICRDLMGGTDERYTIDRPMLLTNGLPKPGTVQTSPTKSAPAPSNPNAPGAPEKPAASSGAPSAPPPAATKPTTPPAAPATTSSPPR